jgi:hypothetical protein
MRTISLNESDSKYQQSPDEGTVFDGHGASASDQKQIETHQRRRLRLPKDILVGIKPESEDLMLMSPYISIIGMTPTQYKPLVCHSFYALLILR